MMFLNFTCHYHPFKFGLRMIDPPFTSIKQSIENGWIAAQLEKRSMTGKLGIDLHKIRGLSAQNKNPDQKRLSS